MVRSQIILACLLFAAPAAAQDVVSVPAPAPVIVTTPAPSSSAYAAPTYGAPSYGATVYTGRGRVPRTVIGTRHETQNDRGLWGGGIGLFVAGWVVDIGLTALGNAISTDRTDANEQDALAWSLLPFVGPLVQLGIQAPHPAIPILAEVMQIGGLVMFVLGMTSTHDAEVPVYAFGDPHDARTARLGMTLAPTAGGGYATLSLHM